MNKRISKKILTRYFMFFIANEDETKEHAIRQGVIWKERYIKSFINWVYERFGEGDITKSRYIIDALV